MALTVASISGVLDDRLGGWLDEAGLTRTVGADTYNDPVAWAIRQSGYTTTDPVTPADSDLTDVATADYDKIFDFAEYRLLETIRQNYVKVDYRIGTRGNSAEQFEPMLLRMKEAIAAKKKQLEEDYGYGDNQSSFHVFGVYV